MSNILNLIVFFLLALVTEETASIGGYGDGKVFL